MVTEAVFIETCWVLGGGLTVSLSELASHVRRILVSSSFDTWDDTLVAIALELMERHPRLTPVDCILAARAIRGGMVVTFDRRLQPAVDGL
jgi:predicted nucleic acid-binding protein